MLSRPGIIIISATISLFLTSGASAFIIPSPLQVSPSSSRSLLSHSRSPNRPSPSSMLASLQDEEEEGGGASGTKKKRRRKVALPGEEAMTSSSSTDDEEVSSSSPASSPSSSSEAPPSMSGSDRLEDRSRMLEEQLKRDIERFKRKTSEEAAEEEEEGGLGAVAEQAAGVMSKVLVADFFVVLGFLGWFVAGVIAKGAGNGDVLDGFSAIWPTIIQPALGILMAGTVGVGIYNNFVSKSQESDSR